MKESQPVFPIFDKKLAELNLFVSSLVREYGDGKIKSWNDLDERVKTFFTPKRIDEVELMVPGWKKMTSYAEGVTLTHVMCVFLGLFIMPEFQALTLEQQQLAKWIVLFHDVEKTNIRGERDHTHPIRSATTTAITLFDIGFSVKDQFREQISSWTEITRSAIKDRPNKPGEKVVDNSKLPEIIAGIESLYGKHNPAALIIQGVLLHMSINGIKDWPQPAPLTDDEITQYIDKDLMPLIKVMHLADSDGWNLFTPERENYRKQILKEFQRINQLIV